MKPVTKKSPTRPALEAMLRENYARRIEHIAEQLRPRFEAGELHGYNDADSRAIDEADREWRREHPRAKGYSGAFERSPGMRLEKEVARRLRLNDARNACLVIAVSATSPYAIERQDAHCTLEGRATWAATWDVLRVARVRRWYKPAPGEEPSNAELGLKGRRTA